MVIIVVRWDGLCLCAGGWVDCVILSGPARCVGQRNAKVFACVVREGFGVEPKVAALRCSRASGNCFSAAAPRILGGARSAHRRGFVMAMSLRGYLGAALRQTVDEYLLFDEVSQVLNAVVAKVERQHDQENMKAMRQELRSLRTKLSAANERIATTEAENLRYAQQRHKDKIEAQMLRNKFELELEEVIQQLKEKQKYMEEAAVLKKKLLRKDQWLKTLQYGNPSSMATAMFSTPPAENAQQGSAKELSRATMGGLGRKSRRASYGEEQSSLHQARRSLVLDTVEISADLADIVRRRKFPFVREFLTKSDLSKLGVTSKLFFKHFHPRDKRFGAVRYENHAAARNGPVEAAKPDDKPSMDLPPPPAYDAVAGRGSLPLPPPPPPVYEAEVGTAFRNRSKTSAARPTTTPNIVPEGLRESKLSALDMQRIISLGKKLEMAEGKVMLLQNEREDLISQLKAKASVSDFLVQNLKTKELELSRALEAEGLAKQQSDADREVISFLDGRVRELEGELEDCKVAVTNSTAQLAEAQEKMLKQKSMYEDLINASKSEVSLLNQLKNEKKVLVKEIKRLMSEKNQPRA